MWPDVFLCLPSRVKYRSYVVLRKGNSDVASGCGVESLEAKRVSCSGRDCNCWLGERYSYGERE